MIEIQNPKHAHDIEKTNISKLFWSLDIVICNLLARRLSGGVLVI
jgi:hypothetical protein